MKIYETAPAPNPRRVRMFLAEKAIAMDYVQIDIKGGENLTPQFKQKAATDKVPLLEFDDGSYLSETVAICRYFEETQPQPPLMGRNPLEKARIEMWQRRAEFELLLNVGMCFRNTTGYFKDRETPVPAWGEECGKAVVAFLDVLEQQLSQTPWLAGDHFSIADITLLCGLDFARVVKIKPAEHHVHLQRWHSEVSQRPSAKA